MNVLVADNDINAQKVMHAFMRSQDFAVEFAKDGDHLLERMGTEDAPGLLIIESAFDGGRGMDLCRELRSRSLPKRPFIFMFSAKNSVEEICRALDSGADDFLSKPFNVAITKLRLRAVMRMLDHQTELQLRLDESLKTNERNQLVQEMLGSESGKRAEKSQTEQASNLLWEATPESDLLSLSLQELNFLLTSSLMPKSLAVESVRISTESIEPGSFPCMAWCAQVLREKGCWVDFMLLGKQQGVSELFQTCLGRRHNAPAELDFFLSEIVHAIGKVFGRLCSARGISCLQPFNPLGRSSFYERLPFSPDVRRFELTVDGIELRFFMDIAGCSEKSLLIEQLRERDVLAEPFSPSEDALPLLPAGAIVTARYLEKLRHLCESWENFTIPSVFRPSAITEILQTRLITS